MSDLNRTEQIKALRSRAVRPKRENTYWSSTECEFLRTMYAEGTGISDITLALQRSETAVMQQILKINYFNRQDYPLRKKKKPRYYCLCKKCKLPEWECPNCEMRKEKSSQ